jgi:hypothetical protein
MVLLLVSKRSYGMMVIHIQMVFVILLPVVNVSFSPLEDRLYKLANYYTRQKINLATKYLVLKSKSYQ